MLYAILIFTILLAAVQIFLIVALHKKMKNRESELKADELMKTVREESINLQSALKDDLVRMISQIKEELYMQQKQLRENLGISFKEFRETLDKNNELTNQVMTAKFESLEKFQNERLAALDKNQKESLERLDRTQNELIARSNEKLEHIRATVEEKLDKTLSERLGKSFETVGRQLNEVQQGLGEMKNLAQDVGGLKKVLSNVKMRGGFGEVQLQMLLENILAPEQFAANVAPRKGSRDIVEFAVKLPGNSDSIPHIWLPIDAKFPKDVYEKLQNAYDNGDPALIETAQKELDSVIKANARDISTKYIDPPHTTNFAIMFLPFEGIYAEVVRKADLLESLQKNYNVIVTGPTTLAAILNSLQMGFRTLAIQKRSSEVWDTLGAVKTEFEKFGGILEKAKGKIQDGLSEMDTLVGTRTRVIQRKLRSVESLDSAEAERLLGDNNE